MDTEIVNPIFALFFWIIFKIKKPYVTGPISGFKVFGN
jgi:hypothetical protein